MTKEKRMLAIVGSYHKSGMGPKQYAASQGISVYQLKYWINKVKQGKPGTSSFIQINPLPGDVPEDLVEVIYPNGVRIKARSADLSFISQLIKVY